MTAAEFRAWLAQAEPSQALTYFGGNLAVERLRSPELDALAQAAWEAQAAGFVTLVQRRHEPGFCLYSAIRTTELAG